MNFETNYTATLPGKIVKIYFDNSPFARILKLENGEFFVHKISTGVYFPCGKNYNTAKGMRQLVTQRCQSIEFELNRDRS